MTCRSTYNDASGDRYAVSPSSLSVGNLCAAQYSGNGEWHRCYITQLLPDKVQVASASDQCALQLML